MAERKMRGVVIAPPPNASGANEKGKQYKGLPIFHPDSENIDDYSDDVPATAGIQGVKVPRTRLFGGTPKTGPYGRVVQGQLITGDGVQGLTDLSNVLDKAEDMLPDEPDDITLEDVLGDLEKEVSGKIDTMPDISAPAPKKKRARRRNRKNKAAETAPTETVGSDAKDNKVKFRLEGDFGSFRGRCFAIERTLQYIVIQYSSVDVGFSPPKGEAPIKLVCEGEEYIVFFVGCEFPLSEHNLFVQVYIRGTPEQWEEYHSE